MAITFSLKTFEKQEELPKEWDVIIIGGGPAGYSAALYCGRYKLKTLVITREVGGMLNEASIVEDYPGIKRISGPELGKLFREHAEEWGAKTLEDEVIGVAKLENNKFQVITKGGLEFITRAIIFATGSMRRKLGVKGENLSGVSYCAECDAPLYKNKIVGVVGGGNSAFHDALVLSNHAREVYIIHRRDQFRADPVLVEQAKMHKNIKFLLNKVVVEIKGEKKVEGVILKDTKTGETIEFPLEGLFIAIGLVPISDLAKSLGVELDETNHIKVDDCMRTNVLGVFAAGDITNKSCRFGQIVTAASEGSIAALNAFKYILELKRSGNY